MQTIDVCAGGEVRSFNVLHQSVDIDVRIVYVRTASVNYFTKVMGWNVSCHTNGDTVCTIYKEVWYFCRHDRWFKQGIIEVAHHINRVFIQVVHDVLAHLCKSALRITHGCRRVSIDGSEVSLPIYEHITHVPVLSHANQGSIYGTVAMGVILTKYFTNDTRTFLIRAGACVADSKHTVKDASVYWLESVANIGESTGYND